MEDCLPAWIEAEGSADARKQEPGGEQQVQMEPGDLILLRQVQHYCCDCWRWRQEVVLVALVAPPVQWLIR